MSPFTVNFPLGHVTSHLEKVLLIYALLSISVLFFKSNIMIHDVQFPSDPISWFLLEIKAINKYFILMRFSILQGFRVTVKITQLRLTLAI